ncbi:MAG: hypothetical protein IPL71_06900 [Anaerolineales bacterium]|uniref:hypothetical protein n=1 Tax=Candidatus Villigracilis proximus TaxID=3140683 RepID=UPI003136E7BA|nr:hypothetical protein [Anaerolineales bacterium]
MKILFLFLDGIGLGDDDPKKNPFARANMPYLQSLLGGQTLIRTSAPYEGERVTLLAVDPNLGIKGLPQSATGQGVLLTGINIPAELGYHYGPKPNPEVAQYLDGKTIFAKTVQAGKKTALLNAYPPPYFDGIDSGKRLYSAIPLALTNAGLPSSPKKITTQAALYLQILQAKAGPNSSTCPMRQSMNLKQPGKSSPNSLCNTISLSSNIGPATTRVTNRIWIQQSDNWKDLTMC